MIDKILGNLDKIENLQDDKDFAFSLLDALFISIWEFKYEPIPFDKTTIPSVEIVCDSNRMHFLNIHMSNGNGVNSIRSIKNPLNIEDYKFVMFDN